MWCASDCYEANFSSNFVNSSVISSFDVWQTSPLNNILFPVTYLLLAKYCIQLQSLPMLPIPNTAVGFVFAVVLEDIAVSYQPSIVWLKGLLIQSHRKWPSSLWWSVRTVCGIVNSATAQYDWLIRSKYTVCYLQCAKPLSTTHTTAPFKSF